MTEEEREKMLASWSDRFRQWRFEVVYLWRSARAESDDSLRQHLPKEFWVRITSAALAMASAAWVDSGVWRWIWAAIAAVEAVGVFLAVVTAVVRRDEADRARQRVRYEAYKIQQSNERWPGGTDEYLAKIEQDYKSMKTELPSWSYRGFFITGITNTIPPTEEPEK